jgi:hypothetical protein
VTLQQNDYVVLLPLAEFPYNNRTTIAHGMTLFYINYGYHPSSGTAPPSTGSLPVDLIAYGNWMKVVHEDCKKELQKSSDRMRLEGSLDTRNGATSWKIPSRRMMKQSATVATMRQEGP